MASPLRWLLIGVASLIVVVLLIDGSTLTIGDGSIPVTVTVHSKKPLRLRKVTYDHYGQEQEVEQVLEFPRENAEYFRDATVQDDRSFTFDVPISCHRSLFGILQNTYYWRRFAVFRIDCETDEPTLISATIPDPRTTKSLTIKIP